MATDVFLELRVPTSLSLPPTECIAIIREAAMAAESHLTIWIPAFLSSEWPTKTFDRLQRLLSCIYTETERVLNSRQLILLPVDVVLEDLLLRCGGQPLTSEGHRKVLKTQYHDPRAVVAGSSSVLEPLYGTTAMGGTFDHLHSGHKVLLTMAAWISQRRVIVAITDDALLGKKANRQLLESISTRRAKAEAFMKLIAPSLQIDTPALHDVYGPTAWDPDVQACAVSSESLKGARAIDAERERKGLSKLKTFIIDVIAPDVTSEDPAERERLKMGSTAIRAWLASKQAGG